MESHPHRHGRCSDDKSNRRHVFDSSALDGEQKDSTTRKQAITAKKFSNGLKCSHKHFANGGLPTILLHLSCPESLLTKEVAYTIKDAGIAAGWLSYVPAYVGHNRGVDAAATCFKKAIQGLMSQNSPTTIEALCARDYGEAICGLRSKLREPQLESDDIALLVSALLMSVDWGIIHPEGSFAVSSHMQVINAILLSTDSQRALSELRRSIFLSNWPSFFLIPVAKGVPSPFESKRWLECETSFSGDSPEVAKLTKLYTHILIRLPRLIALVRRLRVGDTNSSVESQAARIAMKCVELKDCEAESQLLHHINVRRTTDPDTARVTSTSLYFNKAAHFSTAIFYWHARILTNNLCLKLLETNALPPKALDRDKLVAESRRMAQNIIMSWEYISKTGGFAIWTLRVGLIAVWSVTPLMERLNDRPTVATARQWLRQRYNALHRQTYVFTEAGMDEAADLVVGGPLRGFLVDLVFPRVD